MSGPPGADGAARSTLSPEAPALLRAAVRRYGYAAFDDPMRGKGLIADALPGYRREASVLAAVLGEQVPAQLRSHDAATVSRAFVAQLADRLEREADLSPASATWAIDTWAYALDLTIGSSGSQATRALPEAGSTALTQEAGASEVERYRSDLIRYQWPTLLVVVALCVAFLAGRGPISLVLAFVAVAFAASGAMRARSSELTERPADSGRLRGLVAAHRPNRGGRLPFAVMTASLLVAGVLGVLGSSGVSGDAWQAFLDREGPVAEMRAAFPQPFPAFESFAGGEPPEQPERVSEEHAVRIASANGVALDDVYALGTGWMDPTGDAGTLLVLWVVQIAGRSAEDIIWPGDEPCGTGSDVAIGDKIVHEYFEALLSCEDASTWDRMWRYDLPDGRTTLIVLDFEYSFDRDDALTAEGAERLFASFP